MKSHIIILRLEEFEDAEMVTMCNEIEKSMEESIEKNITLEETLNCLDDH